MSAGNWRARIRNCSPTGEKHKIKCRFFRTFSMKKSHRFSGVSWTPACFASFRTPLRNSSLDSLVAKTSGILPDAKKSFNMTRNRSFTICESTRTNEVGCPLIPAFVKRVKRFSLKSLTPKLLVTVIWKTSQPQINELSRDKLCLPLPPTPTSRQFPRGLSIVRVIRQMCSTAISNSTRFMTALFSLYSSSFSLTIDLSFSASLMPVYGRSSSRLLKVKVVKIFGRARTCS